MSKITIDKSKVVIDGHANDLETCNTLTNLCDELSKSDKFRTVKYEDGYGEFESVSESEEKKFAADPGAETLYIKSNDGSSILFEGIYSGFGMYVTNTGAYWNSGGTKYEYTYSGPKLFAGLSTSANTVIPEYKLGDTISIPGLTDLYIVENIVLPDSYSTLTALFSDIATVIREKTGDTASITADDFPSVIRERLEAAPQ